MCRTHACCPILLCTDLDDTADVLEALEPLASRWQILATKLGLRPDAISVIASNCPTDSILALTKAIGEWLKKNYNFRKFGSPSWRLLVQIVEKMDYSQAEKIAHEHRGEYIQGNYIASSAIMKPIGHKIGNSYFFPS